jgi:peptidyl-prolyl cis-trans isomerase-like 3
MPLQIELYCDTVPRTTFNFLALAASGYYTGTIFHRNIKGFMLQGGDPTGGGKGGASIWGGKFADEIHPDNKHTSRGIVSMANSGPNTNGSQFFITYARHPHLDNNYTVFGKVIDGLDTLDAIERTPCSDKNRPLKEVRAQPPPLARSQRARAAHRAGLTCEPQTRPALCV